MERGERRKAGECTVMEARHQEIRREEEREGRGVRERKRMYMGKKEDRGKGRG